LGWNDPEFFEEQNPNRAGSQALSSSAKAMTLCGVAFAAGGHFPFSLSLPLTLTLSFSLPRNGDIRKRY
jgi:hypothetical protein